VRAKRANRDAERHQYRRYRTPVHW
jgi:hypothetical protein